MAYKQLRAFNQSLAGTTYEYCLQNVRRGYSIASRYPTAWDAWLNTQRHANRSVPTGIDVPLFYYYKPGLTNYGHINVRLASGKVWSDGEIFASIADYEAKRAPDFVGWGESINGVGVIQYVPDPVSKLPPVGSMIKLIPVQTRTTWVVGTTNIAGHIKVTDNTFIYTIRGYDSKYPGRAIINSASGGGNGVGLALYYNNGSLVDGWVKV